MQQHDCTRDPFDRYPLYPLFDNYSIKVIRLTLHIVSH